MSRELKRIFGNGDLSFRIFLLPEENHAISVKYYFSAWGFFCLLIVVFYLCFRKVIYLKLHFKAFSGPNLFGP